MRCVPLENEIGVVTTDIELPSTLARVRETPSGKFGDPASAAINCKELDGARLMLPR
jgi:hypothetical protein